MSKREELLNELKAIRLELFRNTANLDTMISDLEAMLNDESEQEDYIKMCIRMRARYREDLIRVNGYDRLCEREKDIWRQLLETKEES